MVRGGTTKTSSGSVRLGGVDEAAQRGGGGASLAQLETVLQRLNKHDERTQIQCVERTSAQTQCKLLKEELQKAQEELARTHTSKSKLCEEIGALQQAKREKDTQIEHLLVELRSSRESQAAMVKQIADLETGSQDLKRNYIRSLTYRMKTASELLSRLQVSGKIRDYAEPKEMIYAKIESWTASDPNKRKRVADASKPTLVEDAIAEDVVMEVPPSVDGVVSIPPVRQTDGMDDSLASEQSDNFSSMQDAAVSEIEARTITTQKSEDKRECQSCIDLAYEYTSFKDNAGKELEVTKTAYQQLEVRYGELSKKNEQVQARMSALSRLSEEKDEAIQELTERVELEKQKSVEAEQTALKATAIKDSGVEINDISDRIKVLEDNLAQLNTYADHLEMLISQCASCSVKLQSENTQASEQ